MQLVFLCGPYLLMELLNMVHHKGKFWDQHSSASIIMTYLSTDHRTLQNAICSRMTQRFIQSLLIASCKLIKYNFALTVLQCGATLITCPLML